MSPTVEIRRLGLVPYREALVTQHELEAARGAGEIPDTLLLLEHPPTYTRGRRTQPGELPRPESWYLEHGIAIVDADRGGGVTYHGPGQLVAYPIVDLGAYRDRVHAFVARMEQTMIAALADVGVGAGTVDALTGVWSLAGEAPPTGATAATVGSDLAGGHLRKIGSIGIHITRGITTHGLAINVTNDLEPFEWVVPCGIENCAMTSVSRELARRAEPGEGAVNGGAGGADAAAEPDAEPVIVSTVADALVRRYGEIYGRRPVER